MMGCWVLFETFHTVYLIGLFVPFRRIEWTCCVQHNQWQNITGDDQKIATGTASRDVNTKWALDGGWLKGTAATNTAIACSIRLYQQTQKGGDGTKENVNGGSTQFGEKSRRKI
jgi:hypothetical protein